tara:strand:+ start:514 stop:1143 length:630 start_codon:yes stop_codon:yes gene_type:complete
MASTVIKSINFHWDHHIGNQGEMHLEKELCHYWKENQVEFVWDKHHPIFSLENTIRFIEKTSNILAQKCDYFLIKDLHLASDQTHKKLISESFKRTIKTRYGGGRNDQVKTYKQDIQIINSGRSRTKPKLQFLEDYHNKIRNLNQSGLQLYLELGGDCNSDLTHIHKQILDEKKSFKKVIQNWSDRERYKWSILEIKKPLTDEERQMIN